MGSRGKTIRLAIAAAVSALTLWLAARRVSLDDLRSAIGGARLVWLLPYPVICVALNIVRGEIWRRLLRRRVATAQAFWAYSVGFLANNTLPFRLGEAARVVLLSQRADLPVVEVAAAAGLERLLDMAALALLLAIVAPFVAHVPGLGRAAAVIVVLVAAAVLAIAQVGRMRRLIGVDRLARVVPRRIGHAAAKAWDDLARGLAALVEPSIGVPAALGASVVWILTVALQWLVLRAFQPHAGAADAAFMVAAVSLASAVPAAPGFVGVYHWAGQQSLVSAFPELYDASLALAAATAAHALSYVTSTALGIAGLWYFGMPLSSVAGVVRRDDRVCPPEHAYGSDPAASTDAL
jgi:glycosyltransferase 2 family protein